MVASSGPSQVDKRMNFAPRKNNAPSRKRRTVQLVHVTNKACFFLKSFSPCKHKIVYPNTLMRIRTTQLEFWILITLKYPFWIFWACFFSVLEPTQILLTRILEKSTWTKSGKEGMELRTNTMERGQLLSCKGGL